ncbi:MAG: ribose ABC transporter permease [Acidiferrobacteraceae bacterium]|nr:ribose ABC transporter permease [Acidiferrobacteraceae bacterium]|tara:strand:- start:4072 stop:5160 length:1089 start_codon:yes stop_codon:yes gene_type:complete
MGSKYRFRSLNKYLNPINESLLAGAIGLAIGAIIMVGLGYSPLDAYSSLLRGSFGSVYSWAESLANATPLILTALTFAIAMRGGLFNIGAEGQLYIGAIAAVSVSLIQISAPFHLIIALVAAMTAGALWSLPVAILKLTRGVHEVISTIMLNWIARFFAFYMIANVLMDPVRGEKTISIAETSRFARILPGSSLNYGIVVSALAVLLILFLLWRTTAGFELRAAGHSQESSNYAGISYKKQVLRAFLLGGVLAGLAGAVQVMGRPPTYALISGLPQMIDLGFDGIAVAMIGRNHPVGIIFAAIFFGGLMVGGRMMQMSAGVPLELVRIVEGAIILALAVPELKRIFYVVRKKFARKEQRGGN